MGHGITATDRVVLAGKPAWHGLGTVTESAPDLEEAFQLAGLGWDVDSVPLWTENGGQYSAVEGWTMNRRRDTGEDLGVVSDGYSIFQNRELCALMKGAGVTTVESMGSLKGGRIVFGLARTGAYEVGRRAGDEVRQYALFGNRHDGTGALLACCTSIRVVCANTERMVQQSGDSKRGIRIVHKASMRDNIARMETALGHIAEGNIRAAEESKALALKDLSSEQVADYFREVYRSTQGPIPVEVKTEAQEKQVRKARKVLSKWEANMGDPRQNVGGVQGTAWAALNSVTQWADHDRRTRRTSDGETKSQARAYASLFGKASQDKATARSLALELV